MVLSFRNKIFLPSIAPTGYSRLISTMSHGTYPDFIYKDPNFKYLPYHEDPMQPEFGSSFREILWARFKKNPLLYMKWYFLEKPYYLWSWSILQGQGDIYVYPVKTSLYMTSNIACISKVTMKFLHPHNPYFDINWCLINSS